MHNFKMTKIGLFPEDWEVMTVDKAFKICNSGRKPINKIERREIRGIYPYYGPTKIQDYINEYRFEGKYVLIAEDGDHFLKYRELAMTQLAIGKFNVNNHAHILEGKKAISITEWFYWFFYHRSIFSHLTRQGAGRYKLNKAALCQLLVAIPSLPEQKKIAIILSTWDKAIDQLQQLIKEKEKQKKGLMQRLLTGKVRIDGFNKKWKNIKLKDITERIVKKNNELDDTVVTISAQKGFIKQEQFFKKRVASKTLSNYYLIERGDFGYNKSYSKGYPMGAFKRLDK